MPFQQHEQTGLVWFTADVLNDVPHGFSTRKGGVSPAPWDSLNLRPNQGDGPEALRENYRRFFAVLGLDEHRAHERAAWVLQSTPDAYLEAATEARERFGGDPFINALTDSVAAYAASRGWR